MSTYNQKTYLLEMIEAAFAGVVLGEGVSLHETVVLDMYGSDKERKKARAQDEKTDWRKLLHDPGMKEIGGVGGLCFFDAAGLRFHLPAYLYLLVSEPSALGFNGHILIHTLTNPDNYNRKRLENLNKHQRRCIRHCLMFVRHNTGCLFMSSHREIEKAIQTYWKR